MAKGSGGNVAAQVEQLVRPVVEGMGLRLWDVRFEKEGPEWYLRIFIDRNEPLDTDTCEKASRAIDPLLDAADPISESYILEVGSPGLGRKLTKPAHFVAAQGKKVAAHLIRPDEQGRREIAGILKQVADDVVVLDTDAGEEAVEIKKASYWKLCDDENLFGTGG